MHIKSAHLHAPVTNSVKRIVSKPFSGSSAYSSHLASTLLLVRLNSDAAIATTNFPSLEEDSAAGPLCDRVGWKRQEHQVDY